MPLKLSFCIVRLKFHADLVSPTDKILSLGNYEVIKQLREKFNLPFNYLRNTFTLACALYLADAGFDFIASYEKLPLRLVSRFPSQKGSFNSEMEHHSQGT